MTQKVLARAQWIRFSLFFSSAKNVQDIAGKGGVAKEDLKDGGEKEIRGRDDESEKLAWSRLESLSQGRCRADLLLVTVTERY